MSEGEPLFKGIMHENGEYEVFSHCGTKATGKKPVEWAKEAVVQGAGEILITSIDREGTRRGYDDLRLIKDVSDAVEVPVITSGGQEHCRTLWMG